MPSLEDKRAQIMWRYSHLFVECNDDDVQHLYWLLSLFFAKCDGLLSPAEVQKLEDNPKGIPIPALLTPYKEGVDRKESLIIRLKFLEKHNINKPKEIIRLLTQGLFASERPRASDRKYLVEFVENPDKPLSWFASRLNVSVSSVTRACQRLRKAIEFRFYASQNYPLFKLRHFGIFFKPNESFRDSMLSGREFTLTLNSDTFGDWRWASFLIPNQERILKEFRSSLTRFADEMFHDSRLYEFKSFARMCSMSMFDGERWFFSEEALGVGAFSHSQANRDILPRLKEFLYGENPIEFDQVDFLLSLLLFTDSLTRNLELRKLLKENDYGDLSRLTVSRKLTALKRRGALFPASYFTGLGLDAMLVFAAECDDEVRETLYHMFPLLPDGFAFRTDKGVVFFVRTPAEMSSRISYLMQSLKDEMHDLIAISRFENIGTRTWRHLIKRWNDEKQYWDFERGFFNLCKDIGNPPST